MKLHGRKKVLKSRIKYNYIKKNKIVVEISQAEKTTGISIQNT